jgi:hypothetical protein
MRHARKTLYILAAVILWTTSALADSTARIVRLSYTEGDVQLDRGDGEGLKHAFLNMPVVEGARLSTGHDARVEVEFEDGSTMRMVPDSVVEFPELRLRDNGGRVTLAHVMQGTAYFNLRKRNEDDFRIAAGQEQIALTKTSRFRVEVSPQTLRVAVFKGDLDLIRAAGERLPLRKEETLELDLADASRYYLSRGITEAAFDYWDKDRDKERDEYARAHATHGYYSSGYSYGYSDLLRYGNFIDVAGYGSLWRPYGYSVGWDPFFDGAWVWYPRVGYVWVSPYQWGWTPYRYGQWLFVSNYGWCWRPTRVWNTWYAAPPVVYPRSTFTKNIPPSTRRDPVIVVGGGGGTLSGGGGGRRIIGTPNENGFVGGDRPERGSRDPRTSSGVTVIGATGSGTGGNTGATSIERGKRGSRDVTGDAAVSPEGGAQHTVPVDTMRRNSGDVSTHITVVTPQITPRPEPAARPERGSRSPDSSRSESPAPRSAPPASVQPSSPPMRMSPPPSATPRESAPAPAPARPSRENPR